MFDKAGAKSAFERFTNRPGTEFKHADLYIFVLKAEEGARIVAHAQTPSLIGTNATTLIYSNGINIGRALLEGVKPKGAWADYEWKAPSRARPCPNPHGSFSIRVTFSVAASTNSEKEFGPRRVSPALRFKMA